MHPHVLLMISRMHPHVLLMTSRMHPHVLLLISRMHPHVLLLISHMHPHVLRRYTTAHDLWHAHIRMCSSCMSYTDQLCDLLHACTRAPT